MRRHGVRIAKCLSLCRWKCVEVFCARVKAPIGIAHILEAPFQEEETAHTHMEKIVFALPRAEKAQMLLLLERVQ